MNRQTLTYKLLSEQMYQKVAAGVLDEILGHVAFYCKDNELPILTCIVVNLKKGKPGNAIPMSLKKVNAEREKVYAEDWYDIYPPTAKSLAAAFQSNKLSSPTKSV